MRFSGFLSTTKGGCRDYTKCQILLCSKHFRLTARIKVNFFSRFNFCNVTKKEKNFVLKIIVIQKQEKIPGLKAEMASQNLGWI